MKRKNNYNKLRNKRLGKLAIPTLVAVLSVMGLGMGTLTPTVAETVAQVSGEDQKALAEAIRLTEQALELYQQGKYNEAIPLAEKALGILKQKLGDDHIDTATSLNNLAGLYLVQGRYADAEPIFQQALTIRKKQLGDDHIDTADSLNELAILYQRQGRYSEAEPLSQQALAIYKEKLGDNHPRVSKSITNLAILYASQGKYSEAEFLFQQTLAVSREKLGDNHPDTASSLNNLAGLYQVQGRYADAEPLYQKALAIRKKLLGDNHPDTASSVYSLANLYKELGKYADAEPLFQQALAIRKKVLGENHPNTASSFNNLAGLYQSQGRYADAEPFYQQALAIRKKQLGDDHIDTADSLYSLAVLYKELGKYADAEPLFQQALIITKAQLGDNHIHIATIINSLATLYRVQGRYSEADLLYRQALIITKAQLGDNHPATATSLQNLAGLYRAQGQYSKIESIYRQALAIYKQQLGENHPSTATSLNNLAILYASQGRYADAEPLFQQALAIRKKILGENHTNTASSLNNLAGLYQSQGRYADAEPLYQQALDISKKVLGENHPSTASSFNNLAGLYLVQVNIPNAIKYFTQGLKVEEYNLLDKLNIGDEKQKQDYMRTFLGTTYGVISLNLQSAPDNSKATQLALKTILQRKGRILDVSTNSLQILRKRTDDPESQKLLTQLIEIRTQLSNLTFTSVDKFPSPEVYRQLLTEVQQQAKELEEKIGRRSAEFRQLSQPITLEGIQQQIPKNSALVEIVRYQPFNAKATQNSENFGDPRYAVYILFPNGDIKAKDLGEAKTIDDDLSTFRTNLADISDNGIPQTSVEQVRQSSRQLDTKLMQPIRQMLGDTKTILLSPDAALNLIPFEALVDENNKYLVENYKITYLTSGRDLLRFKDKFPSQQSPIVLADPIYNKEVEEVSQNSPPDKLRSSAFCESGGITRNFERLTNTEEEAKTVKQYFPQATILTQSQATENALKRVKKPKILHIATHGFFCEMPTRNQSQNTNQPFLENENPLLRSGLVLAGVKFGQSAGDDGVLTALETTSLNLVGTKLVVLSACETGKGDITIGEGVYGLRRALVIAGSESQLISLWKVSDNATKNLMVDYYKQLKDGKGRSEALRNVQLEMLKNEYQSHPSYWAGFIASGDWTPIDF